MKSLSPDDGKPKNYFFWLGRDSLTGLHFDLTQGVLCQLIGTKTFYLASQQATRKLTPLPGSVSKSGFLPSRPDFVAFPQAREVEFWTGTLQPGELIVIPRLWWHSVVGHGVSLSLTHDFGRTLSNRELISLVLGGGLRQTARFTRDFIYHGLLRRPFVRRLTDDPPFGHLVYEMVAFSIRRRILG
ncbi:MAG: cupin-like domain-containing protein [Gammaproteobacteria bacterium]